MTIPKDEKEAVRPAVEGIVRILKAARNAGVKRVVMTSNFGAVGFSNKNPNTATTEADWTDPDEKAYRLTKNQNYWQNVPLGSSLRKKEVI